MGAMRLLIGKQRQATRSKTSKHYRPRTPRPVGHLPRTMKNPDSPFQKCSIGQGRQILSYYSATP